MSILLCLLCLICANDELIFCLMQLHPLLSILLVLVEIGIFLAWRHASLLWELHFSLLRESELRWSSVFFWVNLIDKFYLSVQFFFAFQMSKNSRFLPVCQDIFTRTAHFKLSFLFLSQTVKRKHFLKLPFHLLIPWRYWLKFFYLHSELLLNCKWHRILIR